MAKIRDLNPPAKLAGGSSLHYDEYKNLLMNALTVNRTDGKQINYIVETFIKDALIENGAVGYDLITDSWANVSANGNQNEYGKPTKLTFRYANGKTFVRTASYEPSTSGAYIIEAMQTKYAIASLLKETIEFLDNCDVAIRQNIDACKTPYIVVCRDDDMRLSIETAIKQKQDGAPVVVVSEELGDALKSVNINVEYVADKIETLKSNTRDRLLNKIGIMSANIEKRERVQVGEVNATVGQCSDYIYLIIDAFNKQCEAYGLPFEMSFNGTLEELYVDGNATETAEEAEARKEQNEDD